MPFEDQKALSTVLGFIGDYRPDCVIQLGHLMNLPPLGRLTGQATIELRRRELTHTADYVRNNYLSRLRKVYGGPVRIICSAASARLGNALRRKAVPETGAATMYVERLVHLDGCEGIALSTTYTIAPGWTLLYGDNVAVAGSEVPGASALRIAKHLGVSVIVGHTMRLGKSSYTVTNADGAAHTVTGVEIGNLIDQQQATTRNGPSCGWQHGFAIVETQGSHVFAACIPLSASRAAVSWAGWPQPGAATKTQKRPIAAHPLDRLAVGHTPGSRAPAEPATPASAVGTTLDDPHGRPNGNGGSGCDYDAGWRAGRTSTRCAPVGGPHRSASGAWR